MCHALCMRTSVKPSVALSNPLRQPWPPQPPRVCAASAQCGIGYPLSFQDEVRLAKMEEADPSEHKGFAGLLPSWYHVDCFLEQLSELGAEGIAAEELTGFSKLKQVDKTELSKKFTAKAGGTKKGKG